MARSPRPPRKPVDLDAIRVLARLLAEGRLTEIEIEHDGARIRLRGSTGDVFVPDVRRPATVPDAAPRRLTTASIAPVHDENAVRSPMVGTVYLAPTPGADPFVRTGSMVKAGQTLMIIEAMKAMNQITAPRDGRIVDILVADGVAVEAGQPVLVLE